MKGISFLQLASCLWLLLVVAACSASGKSGDLAEASESRRGGEVLAPVDVRGAELGATTNDSRISQRNLPEITVDTCVQGDCTEQCTPNCLAVKCGDDGCGGSCGSCGDGESCVEGACLPESCDVCGGGASSPYCIPVTACATKEDCPADNYATEFSCVNGGCIGKLRSCDTDQECGQWCQETYPDSPGTCEDLHLECQTWELCGSQHSGCVSTPGDCAVKADCPADIYSYTYACEGGNCVGELRDCDNDEQCGQWCMDTYPDQPAVCANLNLSCRPMLCNPGHFQCVSVTPCQSEADCPADNYAYIYQCQNGTCKGQLRNCASDQQCNQWCQDGYPDYPEICNDLNVKCVDPG